MFRHVTADAALNNSVKMWFAAALVGQLVFATYIALRYAVPLYAGNPEQMNSPSIITGYVEGDFSGNMMLYFHVIGAGLLSLSGLLQLVPTIRKKYPTLHRLNGRFFLSLGLAGALTGLYLTWLRGTRLSDFGAIGVTLNGILIIVAVYYAWRSAVEKNFTQHMRWAVHAFFLVNATWSLRLFLMGWFTITQGGLGNNRTMDGPADIALSFGSYLLPMAFAELFFWAKRQKQNSKKWPIFAIMCLGCLITVLGVTTAIKFMWLPKISVALGVG